ncbi:prolyl oligopeptidase family serine peptidase [Brevibacterium album]|uniref:prolyl oligopeptidase family serine peptidase n=1 Tax=Brevibacterium album TaxID=417948 RepID=UPI0012ECAE8B|nr:prolyl oligopeptidase family serine peptidase [Brevibacterium album]
MPEVSAAQASEALIASLHTLARPRAAGAEVRFEVTRPDPVSDGYTTRLHTVDASAAPTADGGSGCVRVSSGWSDSHEAAAGAARVLLRADRGASAQLWAAAGTGELRRVTDEPLGVWAPVLPESGECAYVLAREPQQGRYGTDPEVGPEAEPPRRITTPAHQANGLGYVLDRPTRLLRIPLTEETAPAVPGELPLPEAETLLTLTGEVADPQAAHGRVSVVAPAARPGRAPDLRTTVWLADEAGPRALDLGDLAVRRHAWIGPDALVLSAIELGPDRRDFVARVPGLYVHETASGRTRRLTPADEWELTGPLAADSGEVLTLADRDAGVLLVSVSPVTGEIVPLTPPDWEVTGWCRTADGVLVVTAATPTSCGEVFRCDPDTGEWEQLTRLDGGDWYEAVPVSAPTPLGEVRGWYALPEGPGPHPVVLSIHGGPFAQYTAAAFDEVRSLTEAGFAVVWSNPRGSAGRGRAWGRAVQGDFAGPAAEDVLAVLDAACAAEPRLDPERVGVQGGSYGGYLTAMLAGSEERFAGAIVERGFLAPESFAGTSDIGAWFGFEYLGEDPEAVKRQSPLHRVGAVRAPVLVIHSEQDLRCPLEQAQQYFAALLRAGADAELLVFPGEDHELSRTGRPRHRIARFEAILDWWRRVL